MREPLEQRIARLAEPTPAGCLLWKGAKSHNGYGLMTVAGKLRRAHRVAYELSKGLIPHGFLVMHTCDNPACVNPAHLVAGTQGENMRDMVSKGRQRVVITEARRKPKRAYRTNSTGHVGVYLHKRTGAYTARLCGRYLGLFPTVGEAIAARNAAEVSHG